MRADARIPMPKDDNHAVCSAVQYTTQVALQIRDAAAMERFYCEGLGLKKVMTLTWGDLCGWLEEKGAILEGAKQLTE